MTPATSGPSSTKPFAYYDRDSRCWRTSPDTEAKASTRYSATLPRSGYLRNGCLYEHPTSAHLTDETASSSLLPTPMAAHSRTGDGPAQHRRDRPRLTAVSSHLPWAIPAPTTGTGQHEQATAPATHTSGMRSGRRWPAGSAAHPPETPSATDRRSQDNWGEFLPAVQRWERLTRPAPWIAEPNRSGKPRLSPRCVEWMMGLPDGWVTDPEIGLPYYGKLHLLGNGVVPQQATDALRLLRSITPDRLDSPVSLAD